MGLLDLLIKPADDEPEEKPKPARVTPVAGAMSAVPPPPSSFSPAAAAPPAPLPATDPASEAKVMEKLSKAIEDANLTGIDFLEFYKVVKAMTMIPDEATRFRAAFSSLVAQGANADFLVQTADHYVRVLTEKEGGFAQYIQDQLKERVQGKAAEADTIRKKIQEKSEQIARLTSEISQLASDEVSARNEAAKNSAEIEAYRNTFQSVKTRLCDEILGVKQKIATYVINLPR